LTPMNDVTEAVTSLPYVSDSASIGVTQGDTSKEQGKRTKSAPPARSSARDDRLDVTEEDVDEFGNDPIPF
jgi:hypothetical protein